ncbi:MAG TPA: cytochrome P450 [Acidimicrobiales bacterium]|nr:cytochrome P450 [Acidimicrobiales bacterium]
MTAVPEYALPILDPAVMRDPYPHYREMRALGPVVRNPALMGAWMVSGYDEAMGVLTDPGLYSSASFAQQRDRSGAFEAATMLNSDPPDHERLRGVVARAFTPRSVATFEPRLRDITAGLLAPLRDGVTYDVVGELAFPLPVIAISEMLGVSADDRDSFRRWSNQLIAGTSELAPEETVAAAREGADCLKEYFRTEIAQRRARPGDDLVSRLVEANQGDVLSDDELLSACVLLLVAGNETTTNLIANQALALGRHPEQRRRVVADAGLAASAVQEVLRFDAPVQATVRAPLGPAELAGRKLDPGQMIFVLIGAANRDPARFEEPDTLDVGRSPNTHLGFGHGIHYCLGASLARLEARLALEGLLEAAPDYDLACDPDTLDYGASFIFHSPRSLPIAV